PVRRYFEFRFILQISSMSRSGDRSGRSSDPPAGTENLSLMSTSSGACACRPGGPRFVAAAMRRYQHPFHGADGADTLQVIGQRMAPVGTSRFREPAQEIAILEIEKQAS